MKKSQELERLEFNQRIEKLESKYQKQIDKIRDEFIRAKPHSNQTSISISKSTTNNGALVKPEISQQAFFGSATIDLNNMLSR